MLPPAPSNPRPPAEKRLVLLYITLACLALSHFIYYAYSAYAGEVLGPHLGISQSDYYRQYNTKPVSASHPIFAGQDHAPDQYRIGVIFPARFLADRLHLAKYYIVYTLFDLVAGIAVCLTLYRLLCLSPTLLALAGPAQAALVALFLASLLFPLFWVVLWERPETLPTALYVALVLSLLPRLRESSAWLLALVPLTLWQGTIRADVPAILGVALVLLSLTRSGRQFFARSRSGLFAGLLIGVLAVGVQLFMQRIVYPHATYPADTKVVQLFLNLRPRVFSTFLIAMLPYFALLILAVRHRRRLDFTDRVALLASCLYLPLWATLGIVAEVRIFVPFLLALTPTAAKLLLRTLDAHSFNPAVEPAPTSPTR